MFKNLTLLELQLEELGDNFPLEAELQKNTFVPTQSTQELSVGWVPPRGIEHGELAVHSGPHSLAQLAIERRTVPGAALAKRVDELAKAIEDETGRKLGKKMRRELKDQAKLELLPRAFPRRTDVRVWFDMGSGRVAIDTASASNVDIVAEAVGYMNLMLRPIQTAFSPAAAMTKWLIDGYASGGFMLCDECELQSSGESKRAVRYTHHELDPDEMSRHIDDGKSPVSLALNYKDRVSFVLDSLMRLKKIDVLDAAFIGSKKEAADAFDSSLALAVRELELLTESLLSVLGRAPAQEE